MQTSRSERRDLKTCQSHKLPKVEISCERCGDYLCDDCILQHLSAVCLPCSASLKTPRLVEPTSLWEIFTLVQILGLLISFPVGLGAAKDFGEAQPGGQFLGFLLALVASTLGFSTLGVLLVMIQIPRNTSRRRKIAERRHAVASLLAAAARSKDLSPTPVTPGQCQRCRSEALVEGEELGASCLALVDIALTVQHLGD